MATFDLSQLPISMFTIDFYIPYYFHIARQITYVFPAQVEISFDKLMLQWQRVPNAAMAESSKNKATLIPFWEKNL